MTPEVLKALQGSIVKWQKIVDGTGQDLGPNNCPLCKMFRVENIHDVLCVGCPVMEKTGHPGCEGTPYESYSDDDTSPEALRCAQDELDFLKSLLPPP